MSDGRHARAQARALLENDPEGWTLSPGTKTEDGWIYDVTSLLGVEFRIQYHDGTGELPAQTCRRTVLPKIPPTEFVVAGAAAMEWSVHFPLEEMIFGEQGALMEFRGKVRLPKDWVERELRPTREDHFPNMFYVVQAPDGDLWLRIPLKKEKADG